MKKAVFILAIMILIFTANVFGQNKCKKWNIPGVVDEVHLTFRKKHHQPKVSKRRKSTKRTKSVLQFDEADALFGKTRRHKKSGEKINEKTNLNLDNRNIRHFRR